MSSAITDADKLACARRELKMRQRVYPRWVEAGRMTPEARDREIAVMAAIVADYEQRAAQAAPGLFDTEPKARP